MDGGRDRAIVRRPGGRRDVGDQVRAVVVAGLGEVHLVPDPLRRAFPSIMRLIVVWRTDEDRCGRQIARRAPVDARFIAAVLLDPGAAERLHRRDRPQPGGGGVGRPGGGGALVRPADVGGAALQADEVCAGLESVPGPLRPGDATALATGLPRVLVLLVAREPRGTAITGWPRPRRWHRDRRPTRRWAGEDPGPRPQGCWPVALRGARAWLEPWIMLPALLAQLVATAPAARAAGPA